MNITARAIRRRRARNSGSKWPVSAQPYRECADGYDVLRPTKGWLHVSTARLRAQARLAKIRAVAS